MPYTRPGGASGAAPAYIRAVRNTSRSSNRRARAARPEHPEAREPAVPLHTNGRSARRADPTAEELRPHRGRNLRVVSEHLRERHRREFHDPGRRAFPADAFEPDVAMNSSEAG